MDTDYKTKVFYVDGHIMLATLISIQERKKCSCNGREALFSLSKITEDWDNYILCVKSEFLQDGFLVAIFQRPQEKAVE